MLFCGYESLKEVVVIFYKCEYGVELNLKIEVVILFGGKVGLVELLICFINFGDMIFVLDLGYLDYLLGVVLVKVYFERMLFIVENNFLLDYMNIDVFIVECVKLMFLNYLNNFIGVIVLKDFFDEIIYFVNKYNILVVYDFVYGVIGFDG